MPEVTLATNPPVNTPSIQTPVYQRHLARLRMGLDGSQASINKYITRYTYIGVKRFNFLHHEYQPYIIKQIENDPDIKLLLYKCSQLGVSEIFHRIILSMMSMQPGFSTLLGMPSQTFSQEVMKTRIAQTIRSSKALKESLDPKVDSASVKQFYNGSILYALGAGIQSGDSSLINRPIRLVCIDELDRCSMDIVTGFRSRQTHSIFKPRIYISTPTYADLGIDGEADDAEIHRNVVKCCHCSHHFFPDYYENIVLPGYEQPLELLTKAEIEQNPAINIDKAHVSCPNCHKTPNLFPEYRKFVVETPQKSTIERKICIKLSPFDAPGFITTPDLIRSSFTYSDNNEFRNQALGLPVKASDSSIDEKLLRFENIEVPKDSVTVFGLDLGKLNYRIKASVTPSNHIILHEPEIIPLSSLESENNKMMARVSTDYQINAGVADAMPYTDMINKLVSKYPNIWSALYYVPVQPKPELYWLKTEQTEEEKKEKQSPIAVQELENYIIRQITLNKNPFFDYCAGLLQSEHVIFKSSEYDAQIIKHIKDIRRVRDHRFSDMRYKWVKSRKGNDHFFHAIIYAIAALKLIDSVGQVVLLPRTLLRTIRVKSK